jgi:hypothetical protein
MKAILVLVFCFISVQSFARNEVGYWVDKITCGENDPYVLGDICLIEAMNQDDSLAIIVDMDKFEQVFGNPDLYESANIMVDHDQLKKLTKKEQVALAIKYESDIVRKIDVDGIDFFQADYE